MLDLYTPVPSQVFTKFKMDSLSERARAAIFADDPEYRIMMMGPDDFRGFDRHAKMDLEAQQITRTATLLRQKLPADIVPKILEYAEFWHTLRQCGTIISSKYVSEQLGPILYARVIMPQFVR
jgi:hypothetical protein